MKLAHLLLSIQLLAACTLAFATDASFEGRYRVTQSSSVAPRTEGYLALDSIRVERLGMTFKRYRFYLASIELKEVPRENHLVELALYEDSKGRWYGVGGIFAGDHPDDLADDFFRQYFIPAKRFGNTITVSYPRYSPFEKPEYTLSFNDDGSLYFTGTDVLGVGPVPMPYTHKYRLER